VRFTDVILYCEIYFQMSYEAVEIIFNYDPVKLSELYGKKIPYNVILGL
jgi:hypothetical protein